jgi:hypothetical protein
LDAKQGNRQTDVNRKLEQSSGRLQAAPRLSARYAGIVPIIRKKTFAGKATIPIFTT